MPELSDFAGRWRLTRRIADRRSGEDGRFDGEALLTPDGDSLLYSEYGTLTLGAAPPMTAERRYLWARAPDGCIAVAFADGRPFHEFAPTGTAEATHWCDPDTYRVSYDFTRWPEWRTVWEVRGPRKDYRMESSYTR